MRMSCSLATDGHTDRQWHPRRIEGVRSSNPLSSTEKVQVKRNIRIAAFLRGSQAAGLVYADVKRRGYGEDGIYFDHRADCRNSAHNRACAGRWRDPAEGPDGAGHADRAEDDGRTRHPDAAEDAQLPDAGTAARGGARSGPAERLDASAPRGTYPTGHNLLALIKTLERRQL